MATDIYGNGPRLVLCSNVEGQVSRMSKCCINTENVEYILTLGAEGPTSGVKDSKVVSSWLISDVQI
jgi:hypothetical protein